MIDPVPTRAYAEELLRRIPDTRQQHLYTSEYYKAVNVVESALRRAEARGLRDLAEIENDHELICRWGDVRRMILDRASRLEQETKG